MNISKYHILSVCVIASMCFSTSVFSTNGSTGVTGDTSDRVMDRADQVKKGDVDARRITEELEKPNPGHLDEQAEDSDSNSAGKSGDERRHRTDPTLKTEPNK